MKHEIKDISLQKLIEKCKKLRYTCKDCEYYSVCLSYFLNLPRYWKIKFIEDKDDIENENN